MKNIFLILFTLFIGFNAFGQRHRDMNRIPEPNREPNKEQIAQNERKMEERKEEYIDNFLTTLEADEFQKHIIKQTINTFFDARLEVLKTRFNHSLDRNQAMKDLESTHFSELKELISKDDMSKITDLLKGEFDEKEVVKKKKRKKNKKQKN